MAHSVHYKITHKPLVSFTVLLVVISVAIFYRLHTSKKANNPVIDPEIGFHMYEPKALPDNYAITGKRISVTTPNPVSKQSKRVSVELNLSTDDWIFSITQTSIRNGTKLYLDQQKLSDYTTQTPERTCKQQVSPGHQTYTLCHWVYGTLDVYEVSLIKDGTFIQAEFPKTKGESFPVDQLDVFVDSFIPTAPEGLPILRGTV